MIWGQGSGPIALSFPVLRKFDRYREMQVHKRAQDRRWELQRRRLVGTQHQDEVAGPALLHEPREKGAMRLQEPKLRGEERAGRNRTRERSTDLLGASG